MHMILLILGILSIVAGGALVALGIPDPASVLASPSIAAGTVAIVGGLLLIGLGSVISHLRRIREAIEAQRVLRGAGATVDAPAIERGLAPVGRPAATKQEPVLPMGAEAGAGARSTLGTPAADPPADIIPARTEPSLPAEKAEWPRVDLADRVAPSETVAAATPLAATEAGEPRHPGETARGDRHDGANPPAKAEPTVLKSGVIEGMAYTLYSDGSIEAELAQGTMRFNSIPELRAHLRNGPP